MDFPQKFVFTKLTLNESRALAFSTESFEAYFVHPCHPLHHSSCEDLVLIDNGKLQVVLYNQLTKIVKFLPLTTTIQATPRSATEKCVTDFNCTGFGKDLSTGDFKVIRNVVINYQTLDGRFKACSNRYEVYSLRADSWREIQVPADEDHGNVMLELDPVAATYAHGACYWPAYFDYFSVIRSFNFATESFSTIPYPIPRNTLTDYCTVLVETTVDGGGLGCFAFECEGEAKQFKFFSWREGIGEWVLLDEFVIKNVDGLSGFVQGRFLCLEQKLNEKLCYIQVYDILANELWSLDVFDDKDGIRVLPYFKNENENENGATPLPEGEELRYYSRVLDALG